MLRDTKTDRSPRTGTAEVRTKSSPSPAGKKPGPSSPRTRPVREPPPRRTCPKCGADRLPKASICKKCGLIFKKWEEVESRRQELQQLDTQAPGADTGGGWGVFFGVVIVVLVVLALTRDTPDGAPEPSGTTEMAAAPAESAPAEAPPAEAVEEPAAVEVPAEVEDEFIPLADVYAQEEALARDEGADYDSYRRDLTQVIALLDTFEGRLVAGIGYRDMKREFLRLRLEVDTAFQERPDGDFVSYRAIEEALEAYSQSLNYWEYRANSAFYRGTLVCGTTECPFQTQQALERAAAVVIQTCWRQARTLRQVASLALDAGDPLAFERDPEAHRRILFEASKVDQAWSDLVAASV